MRALLALTLALARASAFDVSDALANHKVHRAVVTQREKKGGAFGRKQGEERALLDAHGAAAGGGGGGLRDTVDPNWGKKCRAKLEAAGKWEGSDFEFAPPLPADDAADLRVLWMTSDPHCFKQRGKRCVPLFERDFLYDWLLRDLPVRRRALLRAPGCKMLAPRAAYVFNGVLSCNPFDVAKIAEALKICGTHGMLVHFGDENGSMDKMLGYGDWTLILRQYYAKTASSTQWGDKLLHVPLGYSANFWQDMEEKEWTAADPRDGGPVYPTEAMHTLESAGGAKGATQAAGSAPPPRTASEALAAMPRPADRKYTWAFFGDVKKSTRPFMAKGMAAVPRGFKFESHGFAGGDMHRPVELRSIMQSSVFCPAPTGWYNPDSYRFSESLETGCFPLVDGHPTEWRDYIPATERYWEWYFKYLGVTDAVKPFVKLVDTWADIPAHIAAKMEHAQQLGAMQKQMVEWWFDFKGALAAKIGKMAKERVLDA